MTTSILISIFSVIISLLSLSFAVYAWRNANRPLLTARVTTHDGDNNGIALNLLVENTGNRPAKDISFIVKKEDVINASLSRDIPPDALRCFFNDISVPVLANNRVITNAFWHLGHNNSWIPNARFPILIIYQDLDGRKYKAKMDLYLADNAGFAQTYWN